MLTLAALAAPLGLPSEVAGQQPPAAATSARFAKPTLSLAECLRRAERRYPSVAEAKARVRQVQAQLLEARTAPFSDFKTDAGLAMAPTLRGTQIYSQDDDISLSDNMGLAWEVNLSGTLPLWTFGKIDSVVDAAKANVRVKEQEVAKVRGELRRSVKRAYYAVLFARDALSIIEEAGKRIDKQLRKLEGALDDDDADETQLYKMKMYRVELLARESEVRREEGVALAGLRLLVGGGEAWDVVDEPMPRPEHQIAPLSHYLGAARIHRPEVNMARAGVLAREAQLRLEHARFFPDVGVSLSAGYRQAPEVTDQLNPFVRDPGNYLRYGVAVGLRWKLDFLPQHARYAQASAKLEEMRATEQFALGGVAVEVEKAYIETKAAHERLSLFAEAAEYARRWLITVQQGIDIGTYEPDDIVQPAKEYALKRFSELSATYDYHMALAGLALATGWQGVSPSE